MVKPGPEDTRRGGFLFYVRAEGDMDPLTIGIAIVGAIVLFLGFAEFVADMLQSCATTVLVIVLIVVLVNMIKCG